jgi:hypothetical protein
MVVIDDWQMSNPAETHNVIGQIQGVVEAQSHRAFRHNLLNRYISL